MRDGSACDNYCASATYFATSAGSAKVFSLVPEPALVLVVLVLMVLELVPLVVLDLN